MINPIQHPMATFWFMAWKDNIDRAKAIRDRANASFEGYCRAALIAQAMSIMYLAIELNKTRGPK